MKRHSPFNLFIVGLATAAITDLPTPLVQRQISTRYLVLLLEVALGLPCLVVLAVRQPVAVPDAVAVGAPPGAQSRKKPAAASATAPAPTLADPGRTQLGARLALGFLAGHGRRRPAERSDRSVVLRPAGLGERRVVDDRPRRDVSMKHARRPATPAPSRTQ